MTAIHDVRPRSTDADTQTSDSVLQHFYFIVVVVIVFVLAVLRIIVLRKRNQTLSHFFRIGSTSQYPYGSYPPQDYNHGALIHGIQLAPPPAVYRPDHRIRATDIDAQGRRLGPGVDNSDGKDALPAYDNLDRPPKYVEAGWSHGRPLAAEQSAVTPSSPQTERSGMAQSIITRTIAENCDGTHAMAGPVHGNRVSPPAPIHNDLSSS